MDRRAWAFALASLAVQVKLDGDNVKESRLVLGGVASKPWRLVPVEKILKGQKLNAGLIEKAANLAIAGARPLLKNRYKVPLGKGLVIEALTNLKEAKKAND